MIIPWLRVESHQVGEFRIFSIRSDLKRSPRTGQMHNFFVIESVNWVNIIALTPESQLIMVEQYRHGTDTVELEIPGGMMDAEDLTPVATGIRELREETGYEGDQAQIIGKIYPNPAIMSNTCYTVLVRNCQLRHALEFDHSEDIVTKLVSTDEIPRRIFEGKIRHSLVVVALYHFDLWQRMSC